MPVSYEKLNTNTDITTTKTILHEAIPLTGSIISGTYNDENIKNYVHGMFQSVYDYPYLSSSANHIFDLTVGYDESSPLSASTSTQNSKKINLYNQMSQLLLGYTGSANKVRLFESDLKLDTTGSMKETFVVSLSRLLTKDQIKKGTVSMTFGLGTWANPHATTMTLKDANASTTGEGTVNTIGGDYGVLYDATSSTSNETYSSSYGVIFYQAGIAVISSSLFTDISDFNSGSEVSSSTPDALTFNQSIVSASISGTCDAIRHRMTNVTFNNSTRINSTIYFCRMPINKFNYSSNPTYISDGKIVVKNTPVDNPVAYVTTIGLYNASNEMLAVAKLSEPLKKTPSNELTIRVRLDY